VVGSGPAEIVPAVLLSTDGNPAPADVRTDDESAPGVLDQAVASVEAALFGAGAPRPQRPRPLLIDLVHDEGELVAEFDPTASSVLGPVAEVTFIEVLDAGGQRRYLIYRGPVEDNGGRANPTVVAPKIDELDERSGGSVLLPVGLQLRSHGDVVAVIAGTAWLVARFPAQFTYAPVDTAVIQDGTGARALILPISGNAAAPAPSGTYRLSLRIRRQRWVTLDEAATENRYEQVATLAVSL
jgi:hypothetical protein